MSQATGALFLCPSTGRILLGLRSKTCDFPSTWALFGGGVEDGETLQEALTRELYEECRIVRRDFEPLHTYNAPDGQFAYVTQLCKSDLEFQPTLNHEHTNFRWVNPERLPTNTHPQLRNTLQHPRVRSLLQQHSPKRRLDDSVNQFVGETRLPTDIHQSLPSLSSLISVQADVLNGVRASKLLDLLGIKGYVLEDNSSSTLIFRLKDFNSAVAPLTRFYGSAKNLSDSNWAIKRLLWSVPEVNGEILLQQAGNASVQLLFRQL